MALDPSSPRSRRALLTAALAATAVTAADAVARPLSVAAADGDPFVLGAANTATSETSLNGGSAERALGVQTFSLGAEAIRGRSDSGVGVRGIADEGTGVRGDVFGVGTGVYGEAGDGVGVHGFSNYFAGVHGQSAEGIGVHAEASAGNALHVTGRAHFSRSGKATVTAGHLSVTVTVHGGLAGTPLCFANLRSYRAGVAVAAVRPNYPTAGKMRIYLTKAVSSSTSVAWIVTD
jgi:hypothetical protein